MADSNVHAFHRPLTAQQAVLAELRRAMLAGELTPGSQIVQEAIAECILTTIERSCAQLT